MQAVNDRVGARDRLRRDRHPVPPVQHALSALRGMPRDAAAHRRGRRRSRRFPTCSTSGCRASCSPSTRTRRRRDGRRADAELGDRTARARSICRRGCCCRSSSRARCSAASRPTRAAARAGTPVIAPACHDTASAVASVEAGGTSAFLSSGTWSLLGTELPAPIVTDRTRELNFTNEGGVCGTTRLLKNIGGLWLLQSCRRTWARAGQNLRLRRAADGGEPARRRASRRCSIPTTAGSCTRTTWSAAIADYCRQTGQAEPAKPGGLRARDPREPRVQVPPGARVARGGHRHPLRARSGSSAADRATGCSISSPPTPPAAPSSPDRSRRRRSATSPCRCWRPAPCRRCARRARVIDRSFPVERFEPSDADRLGRALSAVSRVRGVDLCLRRRQSKRDF